MTPRSVVSVLLGSLSFFAPGAAATGLSLVRVSDASTAAGVRRLEAAGLRVTHTLPDGQLVVVDPAGTADRVAGVVAARDLPIEALAGGGEASPAERQEADTVDPVGPAVRELGGAPASALLDGASPVLAGDVVVGLVLPESTGALEPSVADWSAADLDLVVARAVAGTLRYALAPGAPRLVFHVRLLDAPPAGGIAGTVACELEAAAHAKFDLAVDGSWLRALGYAGPDVSAERARLAADLRAAEHADAAYLAVVENDRGLATGRPAAMLGGPQAVWFLSSGLYAAFHETGHVFGAQDEYCPDACRPAGQMSGNELAANANSATNDGRGFVGGAGEGLPCMMLRDVDRICVHTRAQIGWDDHDTDGVVDVQQVRASAEVLELVPGPAGVRVRGVARVRPVLGVQPVAMGELVAADIRVAGGPWMRCVALDGAFDSDEEEFEIVLPPLPEGSYAVEVRARTTAE